MQTNLTYIDANSGELQDLVEIGSEGNQSSIRHIDVSRNNQVAYAIQYFGKTRAKPQLVGLSEKGKEPVFITMPKEQLNSLKNYCGSVVFSPDATKLAVSAPRGNTIIEFEFNQQVWSSIELMDGCGLRYQGNNTLCISTGTGQLIKTTDNLTIRASLKNVSARQVQWDNHLG